MKLLILLAVIGAAYCEYLDNDHCEYGPSHWCSNLYYAKKCGAIKHCMDTVWSKQTVKGSQGDSSCTVCQLMVDNARQLFKNQATEVEVASLLAKACVVMPSSVIGKECKKAVMDYLPEILSLLKSEINDKMICSVLGMCGGMEDTAVRQDSFIPALPNDLSTTSVSTANDYCDDCKKFFGDVKAMITANGTESEFERLVETLVCDSLGGVKGLCKELVEQYAPMAFKFLSSYVNVDDICMSIQFCKAGKDPLMAELKKFIDMVKSKPKGTDHCGTCKTLITDVRNFDRDATVQKTIENFAENNVCPLLGASEDVCKQYIKAYAPVLFQLLANELDPDTICKALGFCPAIVHASPVLHRVSLKHVISPSLGKLTAGPQCALCEFILKEIDTLLGQNKSEAAVKNALDNICSFLPSTIKSECVAFVNQYAPVIIELLAQEIDPKVICTKIGLCTSSLKVQLEKVKVLNHMMSTKLTAGPQCALCEFILKEIDTLLGQNKSEAAVKNALDNICSFLPSTIKSECVAFVNQYAQVVIELLVQEIDPKVICTKIGLCTSSLKVQLEKVKALKSNKLTAGPQCALCEFILKEIDTLLGQNKSEAAVKNALDNICSLLPSTIKSECVAFVNQYAQVVIELLIQEIDPKVICTKIGLCTSSLKVQLEKVKAPIMVVNRAGDTPICNVCKQVVNYLDELMKENATSQDLEMALEKVCSILPQTYRNECDSFVDTYGPYILQLLSEVVDPNEVCEKLTLCARQKMNKPLIFKPHALLGKEKCSYGPAYWCASPENAKLCNTVEHCQKHVWKQ